MRMRKAAGSSRGGAEHAHVIRVYILRAGRKRKVDVHDDGSVEQVHQVGLGVAGCGAVFNERKQLPNTPSGRRGLLAEHCNV